MAEYRKKPVVVEAVQFTKEMVLGKEPLPACVTFAQRWWNPETGEIRTYDYYIKTLEGDMVVRIGDWIIKGVKGECYRCKPDIFEQTYELVEEPPSAPEPEGD